MSCNNNTLVIGRPSQDSVFAASCNSSCTTGLGPVDSLLKSRLGPRKNRELVREQIRDYIMHMLGAPVIQLELDEQNIDFCIDQALKIVEEYAGREHFSFYGFRTIPGQSVYELPPNIGYVRKVVYKEQGNLSFQSEDLGGVIPIEYYYPGGADTTMLGGLFNPTQPIWGKMGEWSLYRSYEQMYSRLSSNIGGWEWVGGYRTIKLYPIPRGSHQVTVHYIQRMKDWAEVSQAMQEGALTYAKEILGRIRSKYQNIPGYGGGIVMDGQALIQEAREDRQKWFDDLLYKFGDICTISWD